jgi:hypothetical protein
MPGNRLPLKILEWEPEGTRRRGRPKERWIDGVRRGMTNHGLTEEDSRDRDRWRKLVLGEGNPLYSGQTLDDDDDGDRHCFCCHFLCCVSAMFKLSSSFFCFHITVKS